MPKTLPPFPVDEITLNAVKHSLQGAYEISETGEHILTGADYSMNQLLDLLSGYDQTKLEYQGTMPGLFGEGVDCYYNPEPVYSERDVIAALINEVERLRSDV